MALPGAGTQGPALGLEERARDLLAEGTARRLDRGRLLAVPLVAEFCRGRDIEQLSLTSMQTKQQKQKQKHKTEIKLVK